jgi:predicted neutral ceramidase superfamily lipid hydrolase
MHDTRRQAANRQTKRKPDVPLMKTPPSTVSHRTVPNYFTVEMLLVCVGFVTAICLFILFGLDLVTAMPFSRASLLMDVSFIISSLILGYLSWNAYRDLV